MQKRLIIPFCSLFVIVSQLLFAQQTIQIIVGQQRRIAVPRGAQVNIGDPTVATARAMPGQRQIIITGRSKGMTSLTLVSPNGKIEEKFIEVLQRDPKTVVREIKMAFGTIEGVNFEVIGSMILAKGAVYTTADANKLAKVLSTYPEIVNLVEDITEKRMVGISISVIEVSKIGKTDYNPSPLLSTETVVKNPATGFTQSPKWTWGVDVNKLLDRIAYWVTSGQAKIVANPTIVVTDGNSATFMSGGEIPFEYQTRDGLAIDWKKFGIIIKVSPTILATGNVLLRLEAEVSSIDLSYESSSGLPGIITRKANTVSLVKMGATIALAGIYQTSSSKSVRRVPVLGYLLPFLFASVKNVEETKEIILLLTPNAPPEIKKSDYPMIPENIKSPRINR